MVTTDINCVSMVTADLNNTRVCSYGNYSYYLYSTVMGKGAHGGTWSSLSVSALLFAVACWDGSFFRYRFNPLASDGKFCTRESYDVFLDIGDDVL